MYTQKRNRQTCGYQRGKGRGEGQIIGKGLTDMNYSM